MKELTKAQLTVGLLAYFATVWDLLFRSSDVDFTVRIGVIVLQFVLLLVLSYVILALLEWIKLFDLKTNSILTLFVLITVRLLSLVSTGI